MSTIENAKTVNFIHKKTSKQNDEGTNKQQKGRDCGNNWHTQGRDSSPARSVTCHKCKKVGHFAKVCLSKPEQSENKTHKYMFSRKNKKICSVKEATLSEESFNVNTINTSAKAPHIQITVNKTRVECIIDSGSSTTDTIKQDFSKLLKKFDKIVEDVIRKCHARQVARPQHTRDPIVNTELPKTPWENLDIDFAGPYPGGQYLLILVDEYSRYPVVEVISSLDCKTVSKRLRHIFSMFGLPNTLKSDNAPPFNGAEFTNFLNKLSIKHNRVTPYWLEANGLAERRVKTLKKALLYNLKKRIRLLSLKL
ncbi:Integrase core domain [Popillia japonica]|uniref:Integrase core domain n=1 Tax=Popillia japonica TaxID=7064 RepID=A0AAW1ME14_POPJA